MADYRLDGSGYPRGLSGAALSPGCAGHHIEHIYIKTGCSSRAGASLHAMQQGRWRAARGAKIGQTPHETAPVIDLSFFV